IQRQEVEAKHQGMLEDYQDALFAVVAWVDETIIKCSDWVHHRQWKANPLQLEKYGTRNAGEELFERLARLRLDQKGIREVYYLCLSLGFHGQYFLGIEDDIKLNEIRHAQARYLSLPGENLQEINRLTSQPYEITPPLGRPERIPLPQQLLKAGLAM